MAANSSRGEAIAVDASGNVFITGIFWGEATFGSTVLTSDGGSDMFLAKWSTATNTWAWATRGGGFNSDYGSGVAVSGNSVYVTGDFFSGTNAHFAGTNLNGAGRWDVFVAKYTDNGTSFTNDWAISGGGNDHDFAGGIATSGSSVYITGAFISNSNATFAGTTLAGIGPSSGNMFLAKYTDNGSTVANGWALCDGGSNGDSGRAVAASGGSVYVAGNFISNSNATFAGTTLTGAGSIDVFLAKYTDNGGSVSNGWATSGGGTGTDEVHNVVVSGNNVYVTGYFESATGASFAGTNLTGAGSWDMFLAKYTDNGTTVANGWALGDGGTGTDQAFGLAVSGSSVYVTGDFASGTGASFASTALAGAGTDDVFVAKYTDNGDAATRRWATSGGGTSNDTGRAVAVSGSSVYVVGGIGIPASFGSIALNNPVGTYPAFLARLTDTTLPTRPATALAAEVTVFPTPATGRFTLRRPAAAVAPAATLHNALGQLVRTIATPTAETVVDVRGLPTGIYSLRLLVDGVPVARRVIVE